MPPIATASSVRANNNGAFIATSPAPGRKNDVLLSGMPWNRAEGGLLRHYRSDDPENHVRGVAGRSRKGCESSERLPASEALTAPWDGQGSLKSCGAMFAAIRRAVWLARATNFDRKQPARDKSSAHHESARAGYPRCGRAKAELAGAVRLLQRTG